MHKVMFCDIKVSAMCISMYVGPFSVNTECNLHIYCFYKMRLAYMQHRTKCYMVLYGSVFQPMPLL